MSETNVWGLTVILLAIIGDVAYAIERRKK